MCTVEAGSAGRGERGLDLFQRIPNEVRTYIYYKIYILLDGIDHNKLSVMKLCFR